MCACEWTCSLVRRERTEERTKEKMNSSVVWQSIFIEPWDILTQLHNACMYGYEEVEAKTIEEIHETKKNDVCKIYGIVHYVHHAIPAAVCGSNSSLIHRIRFQMRTNNRSELFPCSCCQWRGIWNEKKTTQTIQHTSNRAATAIVALVRHFRLYTFQCVQRVWNSIAWWRQIDLIYMRH